MFIFMATEKKGIAPRNPQLNEMPKASRLDWIVLVCVQAYKSSVSKSTY